MFRIPGSQHTIALIYEYYCPKGDEGHIAGTVRCPVLPDHIDCDVHDVASAFKRFLGGIPGGILGSLPLFDALVSIQTHLRGDPELTRTKLTKVRARLIALSISSLRSTYRRELICAVLGLLCMVGRAAETARREDDRGRPLPTSDLMGYKSLGVVFGPLLVRDLLDNYNIRLANGHGSLVLTPLSPPKTKKDRKKYKSAEEGVTFNNTVDKIKVACEIAEMLITHWRDIVRHMKNLDSLTTLDGSKPQGVRGRKAPTLRPSMSESFSLRRPPEWAHDKPDRNIDRDHSPTPPERKLSPRSCPMHTESLGNHRDPTEARASDDHAGSPQLDPLLVTKQRSRQRPSRGESLKNAKSVRALSAAPVQEHPDENDFEDSKLSYIQTPKSIDRSSSTRSGKENDQEIPAIECATGRHVKGIVRGFESESNESNESEIMPSVSDFKDFGFDKSTKIQGHRQSQDRNPKDAKLMGTPTLSHDKNQKSIRVSSSSFRKNPFSKDNHIRFVPNPSSGHEKKDSRRNHRFTTSDRSKGNSTVDPLSRVSHEDDLASLAILGQALDSPDMSPKLSSSAEKSEKTTKHDSGVDFHGKREVEKPVTPKHSRPHPSRQTNYDTQKPTIAYTPNYAMIEGHDGQSSSKNNLHRNGEPVAPINTLVEPKITQAKSQGSYETASPGTLSKVASIREMFRKRKSESRMSKSVEEHHKSEPSIPVVEYHTDPPSRKIPTPEPSITPKKINVKAIAEKFDVVKSKSLPPSSPSPAKSSRPQPIASVDSRRSVGVVSPYTINPPPSPSRSIGSIKSGKSIKSFRNAALAQRFQQAQEHSSPTKVPAPKRVLRDFVPESSSPRAIVEDSHEDSVTSFKRPLSTSNSLSVPLKPVGFQPLMPTRPAGMDGAYSSISSSENPGQASSEFEAARSFLHSQSELARDPTLLKDNLTRGNTVLHSQIRNLQQQLYQKAEQIRQLQRRTEMRSTSDTENLSLAEQLREAREEVETWRRRAEGAERKLELMNVINTRNARVEEQQVSGYQGREVQSENDTSFLGRGYSVDGCMGRMTVKRRRGGMTSSEESTGSNGTTVVREREMREGDGDGVIDGGGIADGAKHHDWAAQTLSIMDDLKSWEN